LNVTNVRNPTGPLTAGPTGIFYGTGGGGGEFGGGAIYSFEVSAALVPSVPGPLPVLGVGATFGWSRKIRKRIKASKPEVIITTAVGSGLGGSSQLSLSSSSSAITAPRSGSKRTSTSSCSGLPGFSPRSSLPSLFNWIRSSASRTALGSGSGMAIPLGTAQAPHVVTQLSGLDPAGGIAITAKVPQLTAATA